MKLFLFGLMLMTTSAFARDISISCSKQSASVGIQSNNGVLMGGVAHNYTHASVICSQRAVYQLQHRRPFKCAGVYDFDRVPSGEIDSTAEVDFEFVGNELVAKLKTTYFHGRKTLVLPCEFSE